ncbi:DUF494 family protein [Candidatus Riflebacteria bacterium]
MDLARLKRITEILQLISSQAVSLKIEQVIEIEDGEGNNIPENFEVDLFEGLLSPAFQKSVDDFLDSEFSIYLQKERGFKLKEIKIAFMEFIRLATLDDSEQELEFIKPGNGNIRSFHFLEKIKLTKRCQGYFYHLYDKYGAQVMEKIMEIVMASEERNFNFKRFHKLVKHILPGERSVDSSAEKNIKTIIH